VPPDYAGRPGRRRIAHSTGPASIHLSHAHEAAAAGAHLFIEKPLANTADGIPSLLAECRAKGLTVLVAYNFRFYPPLQILRDAVLSGRIGRVVSVRAEVGQYLPDWRPGADYRQGVTARAELGGGALLELSHEIDYIRWIIGEVTAVGARVARLGNLEIDVEDVAEISGVWATRSACTSTCCSRCSRGPARSSARRHADVGQANAVRLLARPRRADLHPAVTIDRNEMCSRNAPLSECARHGVTCRDG
jgi:predicted dehydrogenase